MTDLTAFAAKWTAGLPPDGADRSWLGESSDGRQWIMRWAAKRGCWCACGHDAGWGDGKLEWPEIRGLVSEDERAFIVRHMALPATQKDEGGT